LDEAKEKIIVNTARLAKRQRTFNRSKFKNKKSMSIERIREELNILY